MTTENQNPNAQGPQTGADGQAQQPPAPQTAGPEQFAGLQKRIDELTAKAHEADRRREAETMELRQMNTQLLQAMATGSQNQQPQVQQPQVEVDPEVRKAVEASMAPFLQAQRQQMANLAFQNGQQQLEQVLLNQHPEVAKRTRAIYADAVAKGAHLTGFSPVQALTWAKGELVDVLVAAHAQTRQVAQGQNFNSQSQTLPVQSAGAPPTGNLQTPEPDMDEDPAAASALYAQRLGNKAF